MADDEDPLLPLRRAPVQARSKERIERILDAAEQLFVEVGYSAATTNQVASLAATSIGSIYEFFRNKQSLARGLADRYLSELAALYPAGNDDDLGSGGGPTVSATVDALHAFYLAHPALGPLLLGCRDSDDLRFLAQSFHTTVTHHVERILAAEDSPADPTRRSVVAGMCAQVLLSVLEQATAEPESARPETMAELKLLLTSYLATAFPPASQA